MMLDTLRFVRGAVSAKDAVIPVLTHFCISKGWIQGANGRVTISSPLPEATFEAVVPAERFLKAIDACGGEPTIRFTDKGKLVVERKPFRALLPNLEQEQYPKEEPSKGKAVKMGAGLIDALGALRPFISDDAERAWASTIYFEADSGMAIAANNAMIAAVKTKPFAKTIQIPVFMIDELLRIGKEPESYIVDATSVTFYFGTAWLKAQLIVAEWPVVTAHKWLTETTKYKALPKNLRSSIEQIIPFCNDPKFPVIFFKAGGISTAPGEIEAAIEGFDLGEGAFHADNLIPMLKCSDKMGIKVGAERSTAIFEGAGGFKGIMSLLKL